MDHYDPETGRIYLDTDGGRLYNPFREGDILMVQQFQGDPTLQNDYKMTKSYELKVVEVAVGDLSDGENRLDCSVSRISWEICRTSPRGIPFAVWTTRITPPVAAS